jgi:hypothetical protein
MMDKFEFRAVNQKLQGCVRITEKGDSDFAEGSLLESVKDDNGAAAPKKAVAKAPAGSLDELSDNGDE